MATDDLKARLREVVACGYMPAATRVALDQAFGAIVTMENRIAELEAQLAARDAEIAAWLRGKSSAEAFQSFLGGVNLPVAKSVIYAELATAIASGDYAKGQTDAQQGD